MNITFENPEYPKMLCSIKQRYEKCTTVICGQGHFMGWLLGVVNSERHFNLCKLGQQLWYVCTVAIIYFHTKASHSTGPTETIFQYYYYYMIQEKYIISVTVTQYFTEQYIPYYICSWHIISLSIISTHSLTFSCNQLFLQYLNPLNSKSHHTSSILFPQHFKPPIRSSNLPILRQPVLLCPWAKTSNCLELGNFSFNMFIKIFSIKVHSLQSWYQNQNKEKHKHLQGI